MDINRVRSYLADSMTAALGTKMRVVNNVGSLNVGSQPTAVVTVYDKLSAPIPGLTLGSFKGSLVSATQNPKDPYLTIIFYVPMSTSISGVTANSGRGFRVDVATDVAEKYVTKGKEPARNIRSLMSDIVAVLMGENPKSFGESSFGDLKSRANASYSAYFGQIDPSLTGGVMKFLLEVTNQMHLLNDTLASGGPILNGDYGVYLSHIFESFEGVKKKYDKDLSVSVDTRKTTFESMLKSVKTDIPKLGSFEKNFDDFNKYTTTNFVMEDSDMSLLFFNPDIPKTVYDVTEAGSTDTREVLIKEVFAHDNLGAVGKLVASSLLGEKVDDVPTMNQVKRMTNFLYTTESSRDHRGSDVANKLNRELMRYFTSYKRLLDRTVGLVNV